MRLSELGVRAPVSMLRGVCFLAALGLVAACDDSASTGGHTPAADAADAAAKDHGSIVIFDGKWPETAPDSDGSDRAHDGGGALNHADAGGHVDAGEMDAHGDAGSPAHASALKGFAIAKLHSACPKDGQGACTGHNATDTLVCSGGVWVRGEACDEKYHRCDTQIGPTEGQCETIQGLCAGKAPGDAVCKPITIDGAASSVRKRCGADLLSFEDDACPAHTHCDDAAGTGASCLCDDGYEDEDAGPNQCLDVDECANHHGGCDPMVTCTNVDGGRTCGACPKGYGGNGDTGCFPVSTQQLGSSGNDVAYGVAADASGNVYVAGSTAGGFDHGQDLFVVKNDGSGQARWTRQLGSSADDIAYGIATDASGTVYAAGSTAGGLDGNTNAGGTDLFIVKYDGAGQKQWAKQLGTSADDVAYAVATDASGNVYAVGSTAGGLDGNTSAGGSDLFIVKYDSAGQKQWTKQLGTSADDAANAVATDTSGNVYATGTGAFIVKLDGAGQVRWKDEISGGYALSGVATDAGGNVYAAGHAQVQLQAGAPPSFEPVLMKYDSAGQQQWLALLRWSDYAGARAVVATDTSGNVYLAGSTTSAFGGVNPAGGIDLFTAKYDSAGTAQWVQQLGSSADDVAYGIALDSSNDVYVVGSTTGGLDGYSNAGASDAFIIEYDSAGARL